MSSLIAPPAGRAIEIISDLHLGPDTPRTAAGFERYLEQTAADLVIVLGDLFEVWIGDDVEHDDFAWRCLDALRRCACQRAVALMVGNRDFLIGPSLLSSLGVIALDDPTLLDAWGRRVVLSHGDALCLDDRDYQAFRRQVRSQVWQRAFLGKPRDERVALARAMRDASRTRQGRVDMSPADAEPAATTALLLEHGAETIVHGHTHRPRTHVPAVAGAAATTSRHVTSDWDLDGDLPRAEVLRVTREGIARIAATGVATA